MMIMMTIIIIKGLGGLWRGSIPTMWRVGPGAALYFSLIDVLSDMIKETKRQNNNNNNNNNNNSSASVRLNMLESMVVGSGSRALVATITCPIVVVKTRFELGGQFFSAGASSGSIASNPNHRPKFLATLVSIGRTEGIRGLFSGIMPTISK